MGVAADRSDEHLALTRALWPRVDAKSLIPVGDGWTCYTYEVNGRWIVQFPRSDYAGQSLRKQTEVLPTLAHRLTATIPEPVKPLPSDTVAMLYRRIDGKAFTEAAAGTWPEDLGLMLQELQSVDPLDIGLPRKTAEDMRRTRQADLASMSERVLPLLDNPVRSKLDSAFASHVTDDSLWQFEPALVHNDLGPEHVLVDSTGGLAGVIDWEELEVGDPTVDFTWMLHERPDLGRRVLDAAQLVMDPGWEERARLLYVLMPFHEVIYGQDSGQQLYVELGVRGIQKRAELLWQEPPS